MGYGLWVMGYELLVMVFSDNTNIFEAAVLYNFCANDSAIPVRLGIIEPMNKDIFKYELNFLIVSAITTFYSY